MSDLNYTYEVFVDAESKKQRLVVGLTVFGGPLHLYVRAPPRGLAGSHADLLEQVFEVVMARAAARLTTLGRFEGAAYGPEYLSFDKDAVLRPAEAPEGVDAVGWAYGWIQLGKPGWYPPSYVCPCP